MEEEWRAGGAAESGDGKHVSHRCGVSVGGPYDPFVGSTGAGRGTVAGEGGERAQRTHRDATTVRQYTPPLSFIQCRGSCIPGGVFLSTA